MKASTSLADRVAAVLTEKIRSGHWPVGSKLPTEVRLVEELGVSRTVVREAISRLRNAGLVEPRQGSGVFVLKPNMAPLDLSMAGTSAPAPDTMVQVLQVMEVCRAVEAEAAGLAAERATCEDIGAMRDALVTFDEAVLAGGDGVEEDLAFQSAIAYASGNPVLAATVRYLGQLVRTGIRVTNEACRDDLIQQVRDEHAAVVAAIASGDRTAARGSARAHMRHAARRLEDAEETFWAETSDVTSEPG